MIIITNENRRAQKKWDEKVEEFQQQQKRILEPVNLEHTLKEWGKQSSSAPPTTETTSV